MSETLALIITGISVAGAIIGVVFVKGKYKKDIESKNIKIAELENNSNNLKELQLQISNLESKLKKSEESKKSSNTNIADVVVTNNSPKSILFVDDSAVIRVSMKKFLANSGYQLTLANDGVHALTILETQKFDLIITDLEMPNLDGFGLISKLSEDPTTKDIPVMIVTGHEELEIKVSNLNNLYGFCKKPWDDINLLNRIKFLSSLKK